MENNPQFLRLSRREQKAVLEAIIFASEESVSLKYLFDLLIIQNYYTNASFLQGNNDEGNSIDDENNDQVSLESELKDKYKFFDSFIFELINEINNELIETGRPFQIVDYGGGFSYSTRNEYGSLITQINKSKIKRRLSPASLEVLAIIAYRQPVSKPEIERIRGVNSNEVVNSLLEKNLIKIAGRRDGLGKPLMYSTTSEFLRVFGLKSIKDLPKLREIEEMDGSEESQLNNNDDIILDFDKKESDVLENNNISGDINILE